jgi:hypothetical protein
MMILKAMKKQGLAMMCIMHLVNSELLKISEFLNDHLEIRNLDRNFDLGAIV